MSAPPLTLYKQLMREAKRFQNYNFREYAIRFAASFGARCTLSLSLSPPFLCGDRHVRDDFRRNAGLQGESAARELEHGRLELEKLRRMATVSSLFPSARHRTSPQA